MLILINAPSILGLRPTGVELLPEALQRAGLTEKISFDRIQTVTPPLYSPKRDLTTHLLNADALAAYSTKLADAVEPVVNSGHFPLVLGGDCSIILGNMLALKRLGEYGLFFLDGHADFYQPEASQTGEAADMDLALVSGRGPDIVTNLEGHRPLVADRHIVQFGQRDRDETMTYGSQQIADTDIKIFELETIQQLGIRESAQEARDYLLGQSIKGIWIHIDVDVLDDKVMPAVDYRLPGGLSFEELGQVLEILFASQKVVGLDVAIYNPKLDPTGIFADKLVSLLQACFNEEL